MSRTVGRPEAPVIDPLYVDVIIRRWQALTGEVARHAVTGETFTVAEQRLADQAEAGRHE